MLIYLDVSCLNRPFDDQAQTRIRLEAEGVTLILEGIDSGRWRQGSSEVAEIEIAAIEDAERRQRVSALLPEGRARIRLTPTIWHRAAQLERLGFHAADAVHLAAAEAGRADVFLSCDDQLCSNAIRRAADLRVKVGNPLDWLKELNDAASNAG